MHQLPDADVQKGTAIPDVPGALGADKDGEETTLLASVMGRLALAVIGLNGGERGPGWIAKQSAMIDDIAWLQEQGSGKDQQLLTLLVLM